MHPETAAGLPGTLARRVDEGEGPASCAHSCGPGGPGQRRRDVVGRCRTRPRTSGALVDDRGMQGPVRDDQRLFRGQRPGQVDDRACRTRQAQAVDLDQVVGGECSAVHDQVTAGPGTGGAGPEDVEPIERDGPYRQAEQHGRGDVAEHRIRGQSRRGGPGTQRVVDDGRVRSAPVGEPIDPAPDNGQDAGTPQRVDLVVGEPLLPQPASPDQAVCVAPERLACHTGDTDRPRPPHCPQPAPCGQLQRVWTSQPHPLRGIHTWCNGCGRRSRGVDGQGARWNCSRRPWRSRVSQSRKAPGSRLVTRKYQANLGSSRRPILRIPGWDIR